MESIEIVAASVEEALAQASSQLHAPAESLKYEVLEETKGLFGKPGKVTLRISANGTPKAAAPATTEPETESAVESEAKPARKERAPRRRRTEEPQRSAESGDGEAAPEAGTESSEPARDEEHADVTATEEDGAALVGILNELLAAGDLEATARVSQLNGRYVHVDIDGSDVAHLVGRRGEVLNSIQYLMNVISARKLNNGVRVVVEGNDYREERAKKLSNMARSIAEQVIERGEEAVLDALPAFERRVIHQALVDMEGVTTYSEGEEPHRYVVIAPASA